MRHPVTKNEIVTRSKATSLESALSIARGLTSPIQHFDEVEFTPRIKTIVENSAPTFAKAASNAANNGGLYARIFTSTPGDLDTNPGIESQMLLDGTAKWTEKMYDMSESEIQSYIKNNSSNDIVYIEYSYKQLGLGEDWFENQCRKIGNPLTVKREILLQRVHGSTASPFDQDDIDYIINAIQPVKEEIFLYDNFRLDVYEPLKRKLPYIVGIDCSTGSGGDNNAITILNPYTIKPVAEFKSKYIGETDFCKIIIELVKKHIPKAIIAIERNSVGDAIIDFLLNSSIQSNLYFDKAKDLVDTKIQDVSTVESMLKRKAMMKKYYGVYTNGKSREDMFAILFRHMAEYKDNFVTDNITKDISRLVRKTSGKIEAGPGFHDDSIMSYLISLYVYYHGNNLQLFGFIKGSEEIENPNQGMHRSIYDVQTEILPPDVVEAIKIQEDSEKETYEDILLKAIQRSQMESAMMNKASLVHNNVFENTPSEILDNNDTDDIPLSFFDELNGF